MGVSVQGDGAKMSVRNYLWAFIGILFLVPPITPCGILILIGVCLTAKREGEEEQRRQRHMGQNAGHEIIKVPDADSWPDDREAHWNSKKWRQWG